RTVGPLTFLDAAAAASGAIKSRKALGIPATSSGTTTVEFKRIESDVAINDINQPTLVEHHVVALRSRTPARGLGDEIADFARGRWLCNVDNAQAGAEPHCKYEGAGHAFVELMRAETRARRAGEWRIEFTHLDQRERLYIRIVADVENRHAGMWSAAPRVLFIRALRLILFVDSNRNTLAAELNRHRHHRMRGLRKWRMIVKRRNRVGLS